MDKGNFKQECLEKPRRSLFCRFSKMHSKINQSPTLQEEFSLNDSLKLKNMTNKLKRGKTTKSFLNQQPPRSSHSSPSSRVAQSHLRDIRGSSIFSFEEIHIFLKQQKLNYRDTFKIIRIYPYNFLKPSIFTHIKKNSISKVQIKELKN